MCLNVASSETELICEGLKAVSEELQRSQSTWTDVLHFEERMSVQVHHAFSKLGEVEGAKSEYVNEDPGPSAAGS